MPDLDFVNIIKRIFLLPSYRTKPARRAVSKIDARIKLKGLSENRSFWTAP
ncbi:hypothetical protein HMPREF9193_01290 [Treponema lecithinolyticum ATCC 700332]|uniref:Uncharacterized protein n=1 Tax=Treponema lecithinolyticum ATCC 700332 TaxID=1321815 RepID=A0ABN0NYN9_TRELE|nr:hypothetical protein HMPREF9193_01290 [Treponema lecithinolyticum ATCC 700332]